MALVSMPPCHSATGDAVNTEGLLNKKRASIHYPDGKYQPLTYILPSCFNSMHKQVNCMRNLSPHAHTLSRIDIFFSQSDRFDGSKEIVTALWPSLPLLVRIMVIHIHRDCPPRVSGEEDEESIQLGFDFKQHRRTGRGDGRGAAQDAFVVSSKPRATNIGNGQQQQRQQRQEPQGQVINCVYLG